MPNKPPDDLTSDPDVDIFLRYESYKIFAVLRCQGTEVFERLPWGIADWPEEQRRKLLEKVAVRLIERAVRH